MELYIDGGCSGNAQKDLSKRHMIAVVTDSQGNVLYESEKVGGSNNIAELWAFVEAIAIGAAAWPGALLTIYTDSRNTIAWAKCRKVGQGINDRQAVLDLQARIKATPVAFHLVWIPREKNKAGHVIEAKYAL